MTAIAVRVDGVPEHFNLAWRALSEQQALSALDIDLHWREIPEGTGRMIERLRDGETDLALLLTEGAVAGIANGGGYRILGCWVASPLLWGVHVAAGSALHSAADLDGRRFAISRYGSGSHLMAGLYARSRGWQQRADRFVVVNNIDGARAALAAGEADIFLWEQFTTQPWVDRGEFRRVDVLPTPWPCFAACASDSALERQPLALRLVLMAALHRAQQLCSASDAAEKFAAAYGLQPADAGNWLSRTAWSTSGVLSAGILATTARALHETGMIDAIPDPGMLLAN